MKEIVFNYLAKHHEFEENSDNNNITTKMIEVPGRRMIVNGQQFDEPSKAMPVTIEYLGIGAFTNVGEEDQPIYGFKFASGDDIWIENLDDFKFWFDAYFGKMMTMLNEKQ